MNFFQICLYIASAGVVFSSNVTFFQSVLNCTESPNMTCFVNTLDGVYNILSQVGIFDWMYGMCLVVFNIVLSLVVNPHIVGFCVFLFVVWYLFTLFRPLIIISLKLLLFPFRSCVKVVRQKCQTRDDIPLWWRARTQGDIPDTPQVLEQEVARRSDGPGELTAEPIKQASAPPPRIITPMDKSEVVETEPIAPTSIAAPAGDMVLCSNVRNSLFSGPIRKVEVWKARRFPAYESLKYKINSGEYNLFSQVGTFNWSTTSTTLGGLLYSVPIRNLVLAHPRFKFLRSLWTFYRFGVRIVIQPTPNSQANGAIICSVTPSTGIPQNSLSCFGVVPHGFMQAASNDHLMFELPEIGVSHWYNFFYDTSTTLHEFSPWLLNVHLFQPLLVPTGTATTLQFTLHMQLTNIHAKWPQAIGLSTQGLFSSVTNNITIEQMRDSTLPMNMVGDTNTVSIPAFGFDKPTDNRNPDWMMRRTYQPMLHSKGVVHAYTLNFTGKAIEPALWKGQDEMSIGFLLSRPQYLGFMTLSATSASASLLGTITLGPQPFNTSATTYNFLSMLSGSSLGLEFEEIVVRFYIPKTPYLSGKLVFVVTAGLTPPATLTTGNFNMLTAPTFVIDLSSTEYVHEFKIPWCIYSEYMVNNQYANIGDVIYPIGSVYVMTPVTTTTNSTTNITIGYGLHYVGARFVNPLCCNYSVQGEDDKMCVTNAGSISIPSDKVFSSTVDELRSIKQFWLTPQFLSSGVIPNGGCELNFSWLDVLRSFPYINLYQIAQGTVRFHFHFVNFTNVDHICLFFDKANRNSSLAQAGTSVKIFDPLLNNAAPYTTIFPMPVSTAFISGTATGVKSNGTYPFNIKVAPEEKHVTVDWPITTPRGFVCMDETTSNANHYTAWGGSILIHPVYSDTTITTPSKLRVIVEVSVGDDFQTHLLANKCQVAQPNVLTGVAGTYPNPY